MSSSTVKLRTLFPDYWRLDSLVRAEVAELPVIVLDWTSDRWAWSGWSIRQQASHLASVPMRWLISKWGDQIFGSSLPISEKQYLTFDSPNHDRRLDDQVFCEIEDVLGAIEIAIATARQILSDITVAQARSMAIERTMTDQWPLMSKAHKNGIYKNQTTGDMTGMNLIATFRHIQFEFYTHLFNMQRSKLALGFIPVVRLPYAGYHTLEGWDSEIPEMDAASADLS